MATYNQLCVGAEGFSPLKPEGFRGECDIPVRWEAPVSVAYPFGYTRSERNRLFRRLRAVSISLEIIDGTYDLAWGPATCPRSLANGDVIANELGLRFPGIASVGTGPGFFFAEETQDGFAGVPENTASMGATFSIFEPRTVDALIKPPMEYDEESGLWHPHFQYDASVSIEGGPEYAFALSFDPLDGTIYTGTASVFPDHGGGDLTFYLNGDSSFTPTDVTLVIEPVLWWTWDGKFDSATGLPV